MFSCLHARGRARLDEEALASSSAIDVSRNLIATRRPSLVSRARNDLAHAAAAELADQLVLLDAHAGFQLDRRFGHRWPDVNRRAVERTLHSDRYCSSSEWRTSNSDAASPGAPPRAAASFSCSSGMRISRRWSARPVSPAACSAGACSRAVCRRSGRSVRTEFPLAGEVLDRATGVIVHSRYVEARVREHGYDGALWHIPHPAWPAPAIEPASHRGSPLIGCFGHLNESKRIPQLLRAFAELRAAHPDARLLLVGAEAPGFDLDGRLERLGLDDTGVVREPYVEEERLWALHGRVRRGRAAPRADDGGDVGQRDPHARARQAARRERRRLVRGAARRRRAEGAGRRRRGGGRDRAGAQAARGAWRRRAHGRGCASVRPARSTTSTASLTLYVAALEQAAGAPAVEAKIARAVAAAAADTGVDPAVLAPRLTELGLLGSNGHVPVPGTRTWPLQRLPLWAWLASLYAVAVAVQLALALRVVSPWIMVDELVYSDMARSFADTGHFLMRGVHANYGFVYPLLLSPAYALLRLDDRRLPVVAGRQRARDLLASSSRRTCSRAASCVPATRSRRRRSPSPSRR